MREYLNYRKKTQPLNFSSAGSIFKNFEVDKKRDSYAMPALKTILEKLNGKEAIPAGYLIDRCGLRGRRKGEAEISKKHANFIVNLGKAKFEDVTTLIELAKLKVKDKFGIHLKEEIKIIYSSG